MVPPQQGRTLRSCHFCPSTPASSYWEHLTLGPRHQHFPTCRLIGAEKPLCLDQTCLVGGAKDRFSNREVNRNSSYWYADTKMSYISVCFDKCDRKQEKFWVSSLFGHVFHWLLCPNARNAALKTRKRMQLCLEVASRKQWSANWSLQGGNWKSTVLFPTVLTGEGSYDQDQSGILLRFALLWRRRVETAVFMCTTG